MALTGLITFIAGTKAKAGEVNTNFSLVQSFVDALETTVAGNTSAISLLGSTKAGLNGSASNTFDVANAINATHAVNKQTAYEYIHNARRYVNGLNVTKTNDNTIAISIGSAYDSTFEQVMVLDTALSKANSTQSANTVYYVYLIAKALGASVDVLISTSSDNPPLPTDYELFRKIATYKTSLADTQTDDIAGNNANDDDDVVTIMYINNENVQGIAKQVVTNNFPNYFAKEDRSMMHSGTTISDKYKYQALSDGYIYIERPWGFKLSVSADNSTYTEIMSPSNGDQGHITTSGLVPIKAGTWYYAQPTQNTTNLVYSWFPVASGL